VVASRYATLGNEKAEIFTAPHGASGREAALGVTSYERKGPHSCHEGTRRGKRVGRLGIAEHAGPG